MSRYPTDADGRTGPVCLLNAEFFGEKVDAGAKVDIAVEFAPMFNEWLDKNDVAGDAENIGIAARMLNIVGVVDWRLLAPPHNSDVQATVTAFKRLSGLVPNQSEGVFA